MAAHYAASALTMAARGKCKTGDERFAPDAHKGDQPAAG